MGTSLVIEQLQGDLRNARRYILQLEEWYRGTEKDNVALREALSGLAEQAHNHFTVPDAVWALVKRK